MPNPVVWFEIGCKELGPSREFYSAVFGWEFRDSGPTAELKRNEAEPGIGGHLNCLGHEPHNYAMFYIEVDDIAATLKAIEAQGGKTVVPPTPIPDGSHFAWFADPGGTTLGLWKPAG